jgi:hypothetical protein
LAKVQPSLDWILLSVAKAAENDAAELSAIVAAGDYLNHAVFTESELAAGLSVLLAAGLVVDNGERFALGPAVPASIKRKLEKQGLAAGLRTAQALLEKHGELGSLGGQVSVERCRRAIAEYMGDRPEPR